MAGFDPKTIFGRHVASYQAGRLALRGREVAQWLEPLNLPAGCAIADVAAGTGNLTLPLARLGYQVTAVEPNSAMREALTRRLAEEQLTATVAEGSAEALPLADHSVAMVAVANAIHWFDHAAAKQEFARVLEPNGWLLAISQVLDAQSPMVAELHALLTEHCPGYAEAPTQFTTKRDTRADQHISHYTEPSFRWRETPAVPYGWLKFWAYMGSVSSIAGWVADKESSAREVLEGFFNRQLKDEPVVMLPWEFNVVAGRLVK